MLHHFPWISHWHTGTCWEGWPKMWMATPGATVEGGTYLWLGMNVEPSTQRELTKFEAEYH